MPISTLSPFIHYGHRRTVLFGVGCLGELDGHLDELVDEETRVAVFASPRASPVVDYLSDRMPIATVVSQSAQHVPAELVDQAAAAAGSARANVVVAIGGGSMIGLAKAVAVRNGAVIVAVPTTYAGSEMTTTYGITRAGVKETARDGAALPRLVLVDPDMTARLPASVAGPSGMNALAHAIEALWSTDANPVTDLLAERAIEELVTSLPEHVRDVAAVGPRSAVMFAALLAGMCLAQAGLAFHHRTCHVLGGRLGMPHAETHAILLPHSVALARTMVPDAYQRLSEMLGADAALRLQELVVEVVDEPALARHGFPVDQLDLVADAVTERLTQQWDVAHADVRRMLAGAVEGAAPIGAMS